MAEPKPLQLTRVTFRSRLKPRVTLVNDRALGAMMKSAVKRIFAPPKALPDSQRLDAAYFLRSNNVLEIYKTPDGKLSGYLFHSLDAWLNYDPNPDPATFLDPTSL